MRLGVLYEFKDFKIFVELNSNLDNNESNHESGGFAKILTDSLNVLAR